MASKKRKKTGDWVSDTREAIESRVGLARARQDLDPQERANWELHAAIQHAKFRGFELGLRYLEDAINYTYAFKSPEAIRKHMIGLLNEVQENAKNKF